MDSLTAADQACMMYVTAGSDAEAQRIARTLVEERLVACANILGPATSIYRWQGAVEQAQEFVLICKTCRAQAPAVAARITALHSYDTPCIVTYDMAQAAPPFLSWILAETTPQG